MTHLFECLCDSCAPWPGPIDVTRLHSPIYRAERSRGLARWLRLPEDAVDGFVEALERSWRRQVAYEERVLEAQETAAADSRAGMLRRVEAVIADLTESAPNPCPAGERTFGVAA